MINIADDVLNIVNKGINSRQQGFQDIAAIPSGDEDKKGLKNIWIKGLYGTSKHGYTKHQAGYKSDVFGPTIGFDANINDNHTIGIAYSYIQSKFKYKIPVKVHAKTHVLSLYSQSQFGNFIWNNILSVANSRVTIKNSRTTGVAVAKYSSNSYIV